LERDVNLGIYHFVGKGISFVESIK